MVPVHPVDHAFEIVRLSRLTLDGRRKRVGGPPLRLVPVIDAGVHRPGNQLFRPVGRGRRASQFQDRSGRSAAWGVCRGRLSHPPPARGCCPCSPRPGPSPRAASCPDEKGPARHQTSPYSFASEDRTWKAARLPRQSQSTVPAVAVNNRIPRRRGPPRSDQRPAEKTSRRLRHVHQPR